MLFVNSRRFYLNKCCKLKQRFLHVRHGTDQTSLTMQLTSDRNVFAHVWGQKADTSSSYCDNIQPHDKTFQFLSNVIRWDCFFLKLLQIRTSNFSGSAATHWRSDGKYYMGFVGNLLLFQQWKNFDNPLKTDISYLMSLVYYVFGTQCSDSPIYIRSSNAFTTVHKFADIHRLS